MDQAALVSPVRANLGQLAGGLLGKTLGVVKVHFRDIAGQGAVHEDRDVRETTAADPLAL